MTPQRAARDIRSRSVARCAHGIARVALLTCMVTVFAAPIRAQRYVSSTPFASLRRAESTRTRGDSARRSDSARVRGDSLRPRGGFRRARPDTSLVAGTEQVLLQLVLEQLEPVALMGLEREGQEVLLPLRAVLEIAEIPNAWRAGRVQGAFDGRDATFSIDVRAGYGAHRNTRFRLPADGVLVAAGEVYVSGRVLEQLLGVNVSVDLGSALVAIRGASEVPAVRRRVRLASRAARAALRDAEHSGSSVERAPSLSPAPARPGFLVDYSAITARGVSATGTATWGASYSLGVGGAVAGGSLFAAGEGAVGSLALHELSWSRGWVDGRGVSALRIGDIWSAGPRPTPLRGITISNAALRPPRVAAILPLGGALPGGWDLEAYHDGQVSDVVSSEDGRYRIDVPVGMGSTTVEFIAYGPNGAQRTFRRTLHTAPQFVAPGRAEYAVSLGACPDLRGQSALGIQGTERSCNGRANADVRYGLRQGVVLRGGMDAVMGIAGARPVRWTPYAGLGAVLGRSAVVEATLAPKDERDGGRLAELSVRYEPSPAFTFGSSVSRITLAAPQVVGQPAVDPTPLNPDALRLVDSRRRQNMIRYSPSIWSDRLTLEGFETAVAWGGGEWRNRRAGVAMSGRGVQGRVYLRQETNLSNGVRANQWSATGFEAMVVPSSAFGLPLAHTWVRGTVEFGDTRKQWGVSVSRVQNGVRVEAGRQRRAGDSAAQWTLSIAPQRRNVQMSTYATSGSARDRRTGYMMQSVGGTVIVDAASRHAVFTADRGLQRGGLAGVAFLDANLNGRRDADEEAIPRAQLLIENQLVETDSLGRYRIWGLTPFSDASIKVDSASLEVPWWLPARARWIVRIPSGAVGAVDIPIVSGGILEGRMDYAPAGDALQQWEHAERLVLRSLDEPGLPPRIIQTFTDGTFYELGVRPGRYSLSVAQGSPGSRLVVEDPIVVTITGASTPVRRKLATTPSTPTRVALLLRDRAAQLGIRVAVPGR